MTDGRRHSVDVPISRTLVALRRVRSLRDPSTNPMSKSSALTDNMNWESNSNNGISLRFMNGCTEGGSVDCGILGSKSLVNFGQREEYTEDSELRDGLRKCELTLSENPVWFETNDIPLRTKKMEGLNFSSSNEQEIYRNELLGDRYCRDLRDRKLELACLTHSGNSMEDVASCRDSTLGPTNFERVHNTASRLKNQYKYRVKSSGPLDDVTSCGSSPCLSKSDILSSCSQSLFATEEVDATDRNNPGCGISRWWSRTPRFRDLNLSLDVEECPLLYGDVSETAPGHRRWKDNNNEITRYSETPRSLSEKFRPKSFSELVGQNVVARSLSVAISKGRITSFYLFHGPRGTGKTSASRIFAAALNCLSLEGPRPCGLCRECVLFFSGRSRDVKEVDSVRINRTDRVKSLIKNAITPPVSSQFKVFIVDECHLLREETWTNVLNNLEFFSQHVVFIMITPNLDKLPRSAVSQSQRYHFPKIKNADIACRLVKICVEEDLDYDQAALDFIASTSNGSLRDAEMMLDQLSLLGKRIAISLAYELIGIVSDDELLGLLDLALSSDASNTVIRARELMRSRIDPMQLISQLANLIMDILAGNCQEGTSEVRRKFFERHKSELDLQKLSHALKILSESEKQLRMSKNQTTWLTVALLQLSSVESPSSDANDLKLCLRKPQYNAGDFCSTSSVGDSAKNLLSCSCADNKLCKLEVREDNEGTLENLWKRTTELCQSNSLKNFLMKKGKLSSVSVNQGMAVADLEFHHPDHVSRAEKSWKLIARSLQSILGCNVEIRINLLTCASVTKNAKVKKLSFSFFSCSRRLQQKTLSITEHGSESDYSNYTCGKSMMKDKPIETCSSCCQSQMLQNSYHRTEVTTTLRNSGGNVLVTGISFPNRPLQNDIPDSTALTDSSLREPESCHGCQYVSTQEPAVQPNCFSRTLGLQKRMHTSDTSQVICLSIQSQNKLALSIPRQAVFETNTCSCDSYVCSCCNINSSRDEDGLRKDSNVLCWRTPVCPLRKVRQLRPLQLVGSVLPCATAK